MANFFWGVSVGAWLGALAFWLGYMWPIHRALQAHTHFHKERPRGPVTRP
jgi:hypothetical protein